MIPNSALPRKSINESLRKSRMAVDGQTRASVSTSPSGDLPDHYWWQAPTGVTRGGLGLRTALGAALPAFVANRITLPGVHHGRPLQPCFWHPGKPIMAEYDARTDAALARLVSTLPTNAAQLLVGQLDEALAKRELLCHNVLSGIEAAMQDLPFPSLRHARGITPDDGDGDDEHPLACKRLKIQALIIACVDTGLHQVLLQTHENEGSWGSSRATGDAEVDHKWMWRPNPHHDAVLEP